MKRPKPAACAALVPLLAIPPIFGASGTDVALGVPQADTDPTRIRPNVLLIVADDFGVDLLGSYGEHPDPARMPVVDTLAAEGMLFRNCWSNANCSPSRATILTGRYSFRTGIGTPPFARQVEPELSLGETTLAEVLAPDYRRVAVGKWHLSTEVTGPTHPLKQGFEHHYGSRGIIRPDESYYDYEKTEDGVTFRSTNYATTESADDAIAFIGSFGGQPWFVYLAFNAPHGPFEAPPPHLHTYQLPPFSSSTKPIYARAMSEAMDTEIGRVLASIPSEELERTYVIFVGDNGTAPPVTTPPFLASHAKNTLYEGGINVPLVVRGPGVRPGTECTALVNTTDLFATIAELAGREREARVAEDSVSLVPYFSRPSLASMRDWIYAERFAPNGCGPYDQRGRAVSDGTYKLIAFQVSPDPYALELEFYDLPADPFEQVDLLALGPLAGPERAGFERLWAALAHLNTAYERQCLPKRILGPGGLFQDR